MLHSRYTIKIKELNERGLRIVFDDYESTLDQLLEKDISFLFIIKISKRIEMYTKHLTIYQGLRLVNFFLKTAKWIEFTLTTGIFNSFNIQNSCNICFQCVCLYVCMCLCLCPSTSGLLLCRMIPETRMNVQVNDVMLRTLLRCLYQFPLSSNILHLLPYFTFEDETPAHRKLERK